jgi:hypothetical protein
MFMRALVSLNRSTGLPVDIITNSWFFESEGDPSPTSFIGMIDAIKAFYDDMEGFYSDTLTGTGTVEIYNMADAEPRVAVATFTGTLFTPVATTSLPAEVALCLSFAGTAVSGINMARRRGRIYLGPLNTTTVAGGESAGDARPSPTFAAAIEAATDELNTSMQALSEATTHSVYSPTTDATGTLAEAFTPVARYWVDDAWDTQRRRGAAPTGRYQWNMV